MCGKEEWGQPVHAKVDSYALSNPNCTAFKYQPLEVGIIKLSRLDKPRLTAIFGRKCIAQ